MTDFEITQDAAERGASFFTLSLREPSGLTVIASLRGHDLAYLEDTCAAYSGDPRDPWASTAWGDEPAAVRMDANGNASLRLYRDGDPVASLPVSRAQAHELREKCRTANERAMMLEASKRRQGREASKDERKRRAR